MNEYWNEKHIKNINSIKSFTFIYVTLFMVGLVPLNQASFSKSNHIEAFRARSDFRVLLLFYFNCLRLGENIFYT